ncbi:MAG: hypothetical protein KatS3mg060_1858 [Dehalococcoidia bacterium]|nr:MAG: hypothetical protein KatS3mg060_1858 [Dehalococcoidia bacterium]
MAPRRLDSSAHARVTFPPKPVDGCPRAGGPLTTISAERTIWRTRSGRRNLVVFWWTNVDLPQRGAGGVMARRPPASFGSGTYTRDRFLDAVPEAVRRALPAGLRHFRTRKRWGLVQLSYGNPRLHYEIWLRTNVDRIELGLHLEADAATNGRVLQQIARHALEVRDALGPACDLEVWTSTWGRVHRVLPLSPLDEDRLESCASWLARCIETLQPLVEAALGREGSLDERGGDDMGEPLASGGVVAPSDDNTNERSLTVEECAPRVSTPR